VVCNIYKLIIEHVKSLHCKQVAGHSEGNRLSRYSRSSTVVYDRLKNNESPLPLTDPRDAVLQHMLNIPYRIIR